MAVLISSPNCCRVKLFALTLTADQCEYEKYWTGARTSPAAWAPRTMLESFTATCQIGVTTQGNQVMSTGKGEVCLNTLCFFRRWRHSPVVRPLRSIADALPVNTQSFHWSILIYTLHSRCIVQRLPHVGGCKASFARK